LRPEPFESHHKNGPDPQQKFHSAVSLRGNNNLAFGKAAFNFNPVNAFYAGFYINPMPPEDAAVYLREVLQEDSEPEP
jgi:hypothetical protein